jgi:hypothetical protein
MLRLSWASLRCAFSDRKLVDWTVFEMKDECESEAKMSLYVLQASKEAVAAFETAPENRAST